MNDFLNHVIARVPDAPKGRAVFISHGLVHGRAGDFELRPLHELLLVLAAEKRKRKGTK